MIALRSLAPALASLLALGLAGCVDQPDIETSDVVEPAPAAAEVVVVDPAVRVEQAERALELGRDLPSARAVLAAVIADKAAPADVRDRAALSLSRVAERMNDAEGAISAIEALFASHAGDHEWPGRDAADKRLRLLLTGKEEAPSSRRPDATPAPFAKVLARYFPAKKDAPTEVSLLSFGGDGATSERLGTFLIGDALREIAEEACPLCEHPTNVHTHASRNGSWTAIPLERAQIGRSVAVFYTHLADPIPARYDSLLPVPMSEVTAHLQKGESLVAAKERPGAPPAILVAAPREAQLADVEEALSRMSTLPTSLTVVKVPAALKPAEIQSVMRATFPAFKKCYEALLAHKTGAQGRVVLSFSIEPDGSTRDLDTTGEEDFTDPATQDCLSRAAGAISFPATGQKTTVKYPISFSP